MGERTLVLLPPLLATAVLLNMLLLVASLLPQAALKPPVLIALAAAAAAATLYPATGSGLLLSSTALTQLRGESAPTDEEGGLLPITAAMLTLPAPTLQEAASPHVHGSAQL
jgi:hypothetical protein